MSIGTGSFMIRGKRNFLTPNKLELGYTVMFAVGEESLANHIGERTPREDVEELAKIAKEKLAAEMEAEDVAFDEEAFESEAQSFFNPEDDEYFAA
jgi:hypothetical protein